MKVLLKNQYEVEVHDKIAERFMKYTGLPLEFHLRHFINTDLGDDLNNAFTNHSTEEITKTLNQCMIDEIYLHGEYSIYSDLDAIGYSNYKKLD